MRRPFAAFCAVLASAPAAAKALPLELAVQRAVAERAGVSATSVIVEDLRVADHVDRDAEWRIALPGNGAPCGSAVAIVASTSPGAERYAMTARVDFPVEALVAAVPVERGHRIGARRGTVVCTTLRGASPVLSGEWQATASLRAGEAITTARARPAPDLVDGQSVTVVAHVGSVRVTAPARLVGDAWVGRPARAVNLATRAVVPGVLGPGATLIVGGGG